jgi:TonB family protein
VSIYLIKSAIDSRSNLIRLAVLCALVVASFGAAAAQQADSLTVDDRLRGIRLYKDGNTKAAVDVLNSVVKRDKTDADAWYYLGLALARNSQLSKARKAFEMATSSVPDFGPAHTGLAYMLMLTGRDDDAEREAERAIELNAKDYEAHYISGVVRLHQRRLEDAQNKVETAIKLNPNFAMAYFLKSEVYVAMYASGAALYSKTVNVGGAANSEERKQARERNRLLMKEAADALEKYLALDPKADDADTWRQQLETLKIYAGDHGSGIVPSAETTTRARILSKPEPTYTARARSAGVTGTVVLRAVFTAEGTVEHVLVLRSLPYGLTNVSIEAARRIKFVPAMKDGKPISMFMQLEYNFNLY